MPTTTRRRPAAIVLGVLSAPAVWLERARGRRRLALLFLYMLIAMIPAAYLWRAARLAGLPDVGDPFGVAADSQMVVGDEDNAWPFYVKAVKTLRSSLPGVSIHSPLSGRIRPSLGDVSQHREAVALWRVGSERLKSSFDPLDCEPIQPELSWLRSLASLEADRLQIEGDMAGAWDWHRALLRSRRHSLMQGAGWPDISEYGGPAAYLAAIKWASDPRTDSALLRHALTDLLADDAAIEPISKPYRVTYLRAIRAVEHPEPEEVKQVEVELVYNGDDSTWYRHLPLYQWFQWFLLNEPERGRRIVRQVFANRMPFCDTPPSLRPSIIPATGQVPSLYSATPNRPGALPPSQVMRWCQAPGLAKRALRRFELDVFQAIWEQERAECADLIVSLAEQLYLREHGALPASKQSLVGPYLERLPEAYVDSTPTPLPASVPNR